MLVPQEALAGQPDIPLNRSVTTVGSSETCRLVLQSRTISRHHAVFLVDGATVFVADLASRTGVLVNGKPVHEAELNAGDRVQIGKFTFRFRNADGPPADPTPAAPAASAVITGLLAVPLHGRIALVGRRETSDVALVGDSGVSAAHAALFHAGGQWYVRDLGSRTGTAVNGQPIVQQAIHFGDRIGVGAATIQFESAVAVPGHAAVDVAPTIGLEAPDPLPTEVAPVPLPLDADDLSAPAPPSMPFGLVAATDHPFAAVLSAAEAPGLDADAASRFAAEVAPPAGPLAEALPGTDLPEESPPLPQPRAWDAVDVNDPPMPSAPAADLPAVPPAPQPKSWDEPHAQPDADEPVSGHGVAAMVPLELPTEPAEVATAPEPVPFDETAMAPSTEPVAGLGMAGEHQDEPAVDGHGASGWATSEFEPLSLAHDPESPEPPALEPTVPTAWDDRSPEAEPDGVPAIDVVEPTEPSPDSALAWEAEPVPEPIADEALSDSQFGRQVDEFAAADTTGPLVEPPAYDVAVAVEPTGAPDVHPGLPTADVAPVAERSRPVPYAVPADLLGDVDDFVFVPGDALPDSDVIFWGDPELDAAAEAAVIGAPLPPVAPSLEAEPPIDAADEAFPADQADAPPEPYAAEPLAADPAVDAAAVVTEGAAEPVDELPVDDAIATSDVPPPDVAEPTEAEAVAELDAIATELAEAAWDAGEIPADIVEPTAEASEDGARAADVMPAQEAVAELDAAATELAEDAWDTVEPNVDLAEASHDVAPTEPADVPLAVAAADSLSAEPFTAEPSVDLDEQTGDGPTVVDAITGEPADVMPAGDGDGPVAEADDVPSAGDRVSAPMDDADGLDPALAVTSADEHPATEAVAVQSIAFDDLLDDAPPAVVWGAMDHAFDGHATDAVATPSHEGPVLGSAVVASDEPVGFELESDVPDGIADESALADWDDLDLLDATEPAVDVAAEESPVAVAADEAIGFTADDAEAEVPAAGGGFGAVVNVSDALVAGLSATAALTPVDGFAAVAGGPAVDTFAAVTDAALAAEPPPIDDDLAFLDFEEAEGASAEASGFPAEAPVEPVGFEHAEPDPALAAEPVADHGAIDEPLISDQLIDDHALDVPGVGEPVPSLGDAVAEVADESVPSAAPEWVETVTEPTVDVAPPVEDPPLQLLASVSIPPPPDEPPAATSPAPAMSGPSLFGFNFEGGSFLGGMPLPLNSTATTSPLPPGGIVFDRPTPGAPTADIPDGPTAEDLAEELADGGEPARVRPTTPPPVGLIGLVAGSVELPAPRPVAPVGLTGLSIPSRTLPPPPVPPPGFAEAGNGRSRSGDVFSQATGPIGVVEAFANRPNRNEQYQIPEVDRSAPPGTALATARGEVAPIVPPPAQRLPNAERLIPADLPRRKKVRRLLAAIPLLIVGWSALVYLCMGKTATVVGTLRYDGLDAQGESARRLFRGDQVKFLCGEDVRSMARESLVQRGKPTGPTESAAARDRAMLDPMKVTWGANELVLTYATGDGDAGRAQVEALLSALRVKDESMSDARARASQELSVATAAYNAAKATDDQIKVDRKRELHDADDRPAKDAVDALERTLDAANKRVAAIQAERTATDAVLAGWQKQDPSKPVDPAIDPEATNLRRQLVPIQAQIAKATKLHEMNGGQGTGDDDPLMAVLQQQADRLKARLDRREMELQRDSSFPPEERARQRETAIEQLGVKVAALKKAEADAVAAAAKADSDVNDAHAKVDTARAAENRAADLTTKLMEADLALSQAATDQTEKQNAVTAMVVVAGSASTNPDVPVPAESDPRPMTAGVGSGLIVAALVIWLLAVAGTGEDLEDERSLEFADAEEPVPAHDEHREPVGV